MGKTWKNRISSSFSRKSSQLTLEHLWFTSSTRGWNHRSLLLTLAPVNWSKYEIALKADLSGKRWKTPSTAELHGKLPTIDSGRRCGSTCWKVFFVIVHMRKLAVDGFMPPENTPLYCTYTVDTRYQWHGVWDSPATFFFLAGTQVVSFGFIPICTHVFRAQNQKICPKDYNSPIGITHPQDDSPFINLPLWCFEGMPKCARHLNPSLPL